MITLLFIGLLLFTIVQRLYELRIADRNMIRLQKRGAVEFGSSHYWVFIALHTAFFVSLVVEFILTDRYLPRLWIIPLVLFILGQLGRVWVVKTMEGRWTTRVVAIKGEKLVRHGPFRLLPHPNYTIVAIEILALPLTFGLVWTAMIFTLLNAVALLGVRIPVERRALEWSQEP